MKAETFKLVIEMRSACIPPVAVREAPGAGKTVIFTADSFTNSAKGRANIQTFVEELRRLHVRAHGRDVVDGNGSLLKSVVSSGPHLFFFLLGVLTSTNSAAPFLNM